MNEKSGSRRGATWVEYVIIAVLIVAAIILALWFYGRSVANSFGVAGQATTSVNLDACQTQSVQGNMSGHEAAKHADKFIIDSQECETACEDTGTKSVRSAEVDIPLSDDDRGRGRNDMK